MFLHENVEQPTCFIQVKIIFFFSTSLQLHAVATSYIT
jgi:hypothetical protein